MNAKQQPKTLWPVWIGIFVMLVLIFPTRGFGQCVGQCVSPPPGMVGWWPGDNSAADIVGSNHGILNGGVSFAPGKVGQAFSLDGVDDFVNVPDNANLNPGTNDFTVDFWMKTTATGHRAVLHKRAVCNHSSFWDIRLQAPTGRLLIELDQNAFAINYNAFVGTIVVNDGIFHHVALVRQGATATLYIDGQLAGFRTTFGVTNIANTAALQFGTDPCVGVDGTQPYVGLLDEIEYLNVSLTQAQIQAIFNAGSSGKCNPGDDDGDGVPNASDPCTGFPNIDSDSDGVCNSCDSCTGSPNIDSDGDGVCDSNDLCPLDAANDIDNDGRCANADNCPTVSNANQSNIDGDAFGDACDDDIDGDGHPNVSDNCPFDSNPSQADFDGDGIGDACDGDRDGDGVVDQIDACVPTPIGEVVNAQGCSISDLVPCQPPGNPWPNHGAYVAAVVAKAREFRQMGLITGQQFGAIVSAAAQAQCP